MDYGSSGSEAETESMIETLSVSHKNRFITESFYITNGEMCPL